MSIYTLITNVTLDLYIFLFVKSLFFLTVVLWLSSFSRPLKQIIVFIRSKNMLNGIVCLRLLEIAMKCNAFNRSSSECRLIVFSTFSMSLGMDVLSTEIFSGFPIGQVLSQYEISIWRGMTTIGRSIIINVVHIVLSLPFNRYNLVCLIYSIGKRTNEPTNEASKR